MHMQNISLFTYILSIISLGTQSANLVAICRDGFDVYKRQGQQYGTGEYFGTNCGISHGYCKGGHFMLVCLLLKGDWLTQHPGSSYVCNNPIPSYSTYSLPLLVVNFGTEKPSPFQFQNNRDHL